MRKDLKGQKFGRLLAIEVDEERSKRKTFWFCKCDCGNMKSVRSDQLQDGNTKSCGCYKRETDAINASKNHKHKMSGTRIYSTWQNMKIRCSNPKDDRYHRYGGRGISYCSEWSDFETFMNWSFNNGYEDHLTLDRINNDEDYGPDNCRWSTVKEQCNNRSTNVLVTYNGKTQNLTEWAVELGWKSSILFDRYERGDRGDRLFREIGKERKSNRGPKCHLSKITEEEAIKIKSLLNKGLSPTKIARELSISRHIIYGISQKKTWTHL